MENETNPSVPDWKNKKCGHWHGHGSTSCAYGLGILGAAIYYVQHAETFWMGVVGILKALVWPAFLVYEVMKFLKI